MKYLPLSILIIMMLFAVACRTAPPTPQAQPLAPTETPTLPPPTPVPQLTATPVPPPATEEAPSLPPQSSASGLFDVAWDDRTPFAAGLLPTEQDALNQLPGASVYHIDVEISTDLQALTGREVIRYTNQENEPLTEIYLRLFPNLMGGAVDLSNLSLDNQPVTPEFSFRDSAVRISPVQPLLPGESVVIQLDFTVGVPVEAGANYGSFALLDDILALAHFYPIISVFDDQGWNVEIPSPMGDVIYADSSFYLVRVKAPKDLILVGSGIEIDRQSNEEAQTVTFAAGPMRDFYLAGSNRFAMKSRTVDGTTINGYAPPEVDAAADRALDIVADAMESYNRRFGPYPFTELDLLATPTLAGGIEYPGAIVVALALYQQQSDFFEGATAHEVAHQWFYSVVGNDQVDDPWLDEALTQYATWQYYRDVYGEGGAAGFEGSLENRWDRVDRADVPIGLPVIDYSPEEYGAIVYGRGPLFLEALAEEMGQDVFAAFLRDYYAQFKWKLAKPQDFKLLAESHCNCNLTPMFEEWVYPK